MLREGKLSVGELPVSLISFFLGEWQRDTFDREGGSQRTPEHLCTQNTHQVKQIFNWSVVVSSCIRTVFLPVLSSYS